MENVSGNPMMDIFAPRINSQISKYVSCKPDTAAEA